MEKIKIENKKIYLPKPIRKFLSNYDESFMDKSYFQYLEIKELLKKKEVKKDLFINNEKLLFQKLNNEIILNNPILPEKPKIQLVNTIKEEIFNIDDEIFKILNIDITELNFGTLTATVILDMINYVYYKNIEQFILNEEEKVFSKAIKSDLIFETEIYNYFIYPLKNASIFLLNKFFNPIIKNKIEELSEKNKDELIEVYKILIENYNNLLGSLKFKKNSLIKNWELKKVKYSHMFNSKIFKEIKMFHEKRLNSMENLIENLEKLIEDFEKQKKFLKENKFLKIKKCISLFKEFKNILKFK